MTNDQERKTDVISKEQFLEIISEYKEGGISDGVLAEIEPVVYLSENRSDLYQVKLLEKLFNEIQNQN